MSSKEGRSPQSGSGSHASHEAPKGSSPSVSIPNAWVVRTSFGTRAIQAESWKWLGDFVLFYDTRAAGEREVRPSAWGRLFGDRAVKEPVEIHIAVEAIKTSEIMSIRFPRASGIEAPLGVETAQTGSTEGESPARRETPKTPYSGAPNDTGD